MPSIVQALAGDVRVAVLAAAPLSRGELEEHIAEALRWEPQVRCVVVEVQAGGALSARDRVALASAGLLVKPSAILVDSRLTRSILTAVAWLGGDMAAFAPSALSEACAHLRIDPSQRGAIERTLVSLRARLARSA